MDAFKVTAPFNIHDTRYAPDLPGIYVWYARFRVEDADWNSAFANGNDAARDRLIRAIRGHSLKFARQEMKVSAGTHFSSIWKGTLYEDASARLGCEDTASLEPDGFATKIGGAVDQDAMRGMLVSLLDTAFPLFCSPLYLGKASDQTLRTRLKQHATHFLDLWERYLKDSQFIERIAGFVHKRGQVRVHGLVTDVRGFGRTLEISYPWKCKLTEGSERCSKILPRLTLDQARALRYPAIRDSAVGSGRDATHTLGAS